MSEQEQHYNPEDAARETEQPIDIMSLKKLDMTVDDYSRYAELEPDDPQIVDLMDKYNIMPGESIIVSAIDSEHPESNILRVVATGEDFFTTNRSLTNELEARLLDAESEIPREEALVDQAERSGASEDVVEELGDIALEGVGIHNTARASEADADHMRESEVKTGLSTSLIEDLTTRLTNVARTSRENFGQRNKLDSASEAHSVLEGFKNGLLSKEDFLVASSVLLGASSERSGIEGIFSMMRSSGELSDTEVEDISAQLSSIAEANSIANPKGDQVKIGYINSLISKTQRILEMNNNIPNDQYKLLVGLVTGLSTQVSNRAVSQNLTSGALSQLRKMNIET